MAKVLIAHTSTKTYGSREEAVASVEWIIQNLRSKGPVFPYAYEQHSDGWHYVAFAEPTPPIEVEDFKRRQVEDPFGLPTLFDNQKLVIVE